MLTTDVPIEACQQVLVCYTSLKAINHFQQLINYFINFQCSGLGNVFEQCIR